jgi:asparagine synthase (glutamine-hydrolysing)
MCGIVGVRRFDGTAVEEPLLRRMASLLEHRGPDGEGYWADGAVGFGHRRLSIIDVAGSPQPMASPDGRCHLTFNGEVLNYRALRSRLSYPFRTGGDTETILAAFEAHGPDAVHHLDGQFAFALFDELASDLWLFRDRMGILPLYYYADEHLFAFASEIKALLPALPQAPGIDEASLNDYLAHRSVPAPHTLFKGITKLRAGHRLRVDAGGHVTVERYWSIPEAAEERAIDPADAVDQTETLLRRSVESALVADVPVGAYLSGGVDSSLIVAIMSALRNGEGVETFSAGFGDPRHDELPYARTVSDLLGTRHHEVNVTAEDFMALWPRLTWHRDAPISEPADVAVFRLAELARRQVKVVLSGEGSDELFAGYPKYSAARWLRAADAVPGPLRRSMAHFVEQRLPERGSRLRVPLRALEATSDAERLRSWFAPFTERERAALAGHLPSHRNATPDGSGDVVRRMLEVDSSAWLSDNLLERGDRMSMAASLELRPPFLDRRLVEFAFSLPSDVKVRRGTTKWVVKEVARRYLPGHIVDRRKVGFRVPLDVWFRGGLRTMAWDLLDSPSSFVGQVFDRSAVRTLLERHDRGTSNEEIRLWTLLCLEVWHTAFFTAPPMALEPLAVP